MKIFFIFFGNPKTCCIFAVLVPAKPLNNAQMLRVVLFYNRLNSKTMQNHIPYNKPYKSPQDLVSLLQTRGLIINNQSRAENYIRHIGYYRLSAYMFPLLKLPKDKHLFKNNITFQNVLELYKFDKKFRLLIFNEIEKIEIAVRSAIVNYGSQIFNDPYWMTDGSYFMSPSRFQATLSLISKELSHSKEDFIIHFKTKYSNPYPPAWILAEILPLGIIMNVYYNIRDKQVKKKIANEFDLKVKPFESWMSIITLTRNSCCHHTRIWNKQNTMQPMEPKHITKPWIRLQTDRLRIYFNLCIIKWFLDCISPNNNLKDKITTLLDRFPSVDINAMGFPTDWLKEELWKG